MNDNPFLMAGCVTPVASVNKLKIMDLEGIDLDDYLKGKTAYDIFSTRLFIEEIKEYSKQLNIDIKHCQEGMLPQNFEKCLYSENQLVRVVSEKIMKKFGRRLGIVLLVLRRGDLINRAARDDWKEEHWNYWNSINKVALMGGLASGRLGEKLKYYIEDFYEENRQKGFEILLAENAYNYGIIGCSTLVRQDINKALIFDFGHSFIKRSCVAYDGNILKKVYNLKKLEAKWVKFNYKDIDTEREESFSLNNYIVEVVGNTYIEVIKTGLDPGNEILISIANYIEQGKICPRGGYGKLRFFAEKYEEYLSDQISNVLNRRINIKLIHDASAAALVFEDMKNTACITLGTAFGVGFPQGKTLPRRISKELEIVDLYD